MLNGEHDLPTETAGRQRRIVLFSSSACDVFWTRRHVHHIWSAVLINETLGKTELLLHDSRLRREAKVKLSDDATC